MQNVLDEQDTSDRFSEPPAGIWPSISTGVDHFPDEAFEAEAPMATGMSSRTIPAINCPKLLREGDRPWCVNVDRFNMIAQLKIWAQWHRILATTQLDTRARTGTSSLFRW
jgi:hypothetical protein